MVFFQLNVTGLLFQSFRTASPLFPLSLLLNQLFQTSIFFAALQGYVSPAQNRV